MTVIHAERLSLLPHEFIREATLTDAIAQLGPVSVPLFMTTFLLRVNALINTSTNTKAVTNKKIINHCTKLGILITIKTLSATGADLLKKLEDSNERFFVQVFSPNLDNYGVFYLGTEMIDGKEMFHKARLSSMMFSPNPPSMVEYEKEPAEQPQVKEKATQLETNSIVLLNCFIDDVIRKAGISKEDVRSLNTFQNYVIALSERHDNLTHSALMHPINTKCIGLSPNTDVRISITKPGPYGNMVLALFEGKLNQ